MFQHVSCQAQLAGSTKVVCVFDVLQQMQTRSADEVS